MSSASFVLLATVCSVLFVACLALPSSRILGGSDAGTDAFPYLVSVRVGGSHACGGSIIAANYILTAAHCVSSVGITPVASSSVTVRVGSTNQYAGGTVQTVSEITIHSSYGSFLNDIALLKLSSNLVLGSRVQIVALAESDEDVAAGDTVTVAGWGSTVSGGSYAVKLQYGNSVVLSATDCDDSIGYGYPTTLCLANEAGTGTCNGDAGGPAVFNNVLVGVSNLVIGTCGTKYPDVFAKVSAYKTWIDSIINA